MICIFPLQDANLFAVKLALLFLLGAAISWVYFCIYMHTYTYIYLSIYMYTYIYTYVYICIHTYIYV